MSYKPPWNTMETRQKYHWSGKRDSSSRPQPWQHCAPDRSLGRGNRFPGVSATPAGEWEVSGSFRARSNPERLGEKATKAVESGGPYIQRELKRGQCGAHETRCVASDSDSGCPIK